MKSIRFLLVLLFVVQISYSQNAEDVVIAKRLKLHSMVLNEDETIFVSTPNSYTSSNKSYPVLYVLDGSETTIEFVAGLTKNLADYEVVPEMIIVAIATNNSKRDFTPTKPKNRPDDFYKRIPHSGEADNYLSYIDTELFPFIEKNYRTLPYKILAGHSDPGLCVIHAFLSHANMFDSYIATSPSLGWDSSIINKVADEKISTINLNRKQIFTSISGKELPVSIVDANAFARTLRLKAPADLKWQFRYYENEDHYSVATIALYDGLRFIFEGWKFDFDVFLSKGVEAIKSFYLDQSEKYGYKIQPDGNILNMIGMQMARSGRPEEALKVFTYNTQINSQYPEAFSYLGSHYLMNDQKELAIFNLEKAVELATTLKDDKLATYKSQLEDAKAGKK